MIREFCYEWVLLCCNFFGMDNKKGFVDISNWRVYEKKGWLNWEVKELK